MESMWMKLYRYADYALQHAKVQGYRGFYLNYQNDLPGRTLDAA